jgi:PAS domain S-box-containing protein
MLNTQYIPHGHCYLWQTPLVGLHVVADAMIAIAYFSISLILIYFVRQVKELPFQNIFILFGSFILSCGTTHVVEIWTLWHPNYWIYGILKAITALISLYTACSLIPIIPLALKFPSPQHLAKLNQQLNQQIIEKEIAKEKVQQLNQELEQRVGEKTFALLKANQDLQEITRFREQLNDLMPNILYIYDLATSKNVYCNPFVTELLGYSAEQLQKFQDSLLDELIHPEDLPLLKHHFANCLLLEDDKYLETEYRIKNTTGQWHWLHDKNTVFARNSSGEVTQILGIAQDVTQTKQVQLQSKELNQKLAEQIKNLKIRDHARIKLAQLNGFVQACTNLEEVQYVIADLLQPLFPHTAGVVYLMSSMENIIMCAERIRAGVNRLKLEHEGQQLDSISVSIGVACFPDDGTDVEKLIKAADKALYDAKEGGRNCVKRYE